MQVMPTNSGGVFKRNFCAFRFPAREHIAFHRNYSHGRIGRQKICVGMAENILDRAAQH
jgi:hypothetical protein